MNSKQRRKRRREGLEFLAILEEIADWIESGKGTPDEVVAHIREIRAMLEAGGR